MKVDAYLVAKNAYTGDDWNTSQQRQAAIQALSRSDVIRRRFEKFRRCLMCLLTVALHHTSCVWGQCRQDLFPVKEDMGNLD